MGIGEWDLYFCTTNNIEGQTNTIVKTMAKAQPYCLHVKMLAINDQNGTEQEK